MFVEDIFLLNEAFLVPKVLAEEVTREEWEEFRRFVRTRLRRSSNIDPNRISYEKLLKRFSTETISARDAQKALRIVQEELGIQNSRLKDNSSFILQKIKSLFVKSDGSATTTSKAILALSAATMLANAVMPYFDADTDGDDLDKIVQEEPPTPDKAIDTATAQEVENAAFFAFDDDAKIVDLIQQLRFDGKNYDEIIAVMAELHQVKKDALQQMSGFIEEVSEVSGSVQVQKIELKQMIEDEIFDIAGISKSFKTTEFTKRDIEKAKDSFKNTKIKITLKTQYAKDAQRKLLSLVDLYEDTIKNQAQKVFKKYKDLTLSLEKLVGNEKLINFLEGGLSQGNLEFLYSKSVGDTPWSYQIHKVNGGQELSFLFKLIKENIHSQYKNERKAAQYLAFSKIENSDQLVKGVEGIALAEQIRDMLQSNKDIRWILSNFPEKDIVEHEKYSIFVMDPVRQSNSLENELFTGKEIKTLFTALNTIMDFDVSPASTKLDNMMNESILEAVAQDIMHSVQDKPDFLEWVVRHVTSQIGMTVELQKDLQVMHKNRVLTIEKGNSIRISQLLRKGSSYPVDPMDRMTYQFFSKDVSKSTSPLYAKFLLTVIDGDHGNKIVTANGVFIMDAAFPHDWEDLRNEYNKTNNTRFVQEDHEGKSYGWVGVYLSGEIAQKICCWRDMMLGNNIVQECGFPHVTVKYGVAVEDVAKIQSLAHKFPKRISYTLGKMDKFRHEEQDVIFIHVDSPEIRTIHQLLCKELPNLTTYSEFTPHVTLGYYPKGHCEGAVGCIDFEGVKGYADELTYCTPSKEKIRICTATGELKENSINETSRADLSNGTGVLGIQKTVIGNENPDHSRKKQKISLAYMEEVSEAQALYQDNIPMLEKELKKIERKYKRKKKKLNENVMQGDFTKEREILYSEYEAEIKI